ncbi:hypothetical Protein YC6258_03816 [Gynuella sunshinyii YC6258]|uniref:Uncharacterized protein n=1 Tax=Gynuella sunshinyii YC6258 TaxID=1445510 RepID=A0A0C5VMB3_9GAMM|nr:hypothetical Protein YC6258_03816 [Gynuella sunshinyii YC6258]
MEALKSGIFACLGCTAKLKEPLCQIAKVGYDVVFYTKI